MTATVGSRRCRHVADAALSAGKRAGAGRRLHRLLRLRPHARHLPEQVQQSREFPRLPLRAAAADGASEMLDIEGRAARRRWSRRRARGSARRTTTAPTSRAPASIAACCWCASSSIPDLCQPFDPRPYPADWHLHRSEERYLGFIFDRCREVAEPQPGDVMVLRYGRCYSHGGIVTSAKPADDRARVFHPARRVIEEEIDHNSRLSEPARKPRFFSYWAKTAMSGAIFRRRVAADDDAGLYRPANPDGRQHAADPDRVGRVASSRRTSSGTTTSRPTEQWRRQGQRRQGRPVQRRRRSSVSYTYSASIILALCEGPIAGINQVWKNQSVYTLAETRAVAVHRHDAAERSGATSPPRTPRRRSAIRAPPMCARRITAWATAQRSTTTISRCRGFATAPATASCNINALYVAGSGTGYASSMPIRR